MTASVKSPIKALASLSLLALFILGVGKPAFFPSLRLLKDTQWDFSLFPQLGGEKLLAMGWMLLIGPGFWGWALALESGLFKKKQAPAGPLIGMAVAVALFSLYVLGLSINGILFRPFVVLFFLPFLTAGWEGFIGFARTRKWDRTMVLPGLLFLPWAFEFLSPPLVWDAVLDHFRYAREISRLHQMPLHWTNHTGDMPKFAELIWAGFWSLGGESLSKLSSAIPAFLMAGLLLRSSREWGVRKGIASLLFWTCPFYLAVFAWGYVEGFLAFYEVLALYCCWMALKDVKSRVWLLLTAFFLGAAFAIKYTAVLAIGAVVLLFAREKIMKRVSFKLDGYCLLAFALPLFPWLLKNVMAFGNPIYPLASSLFGAAVGYDTQMENGLWQDTGMPQAFTLFGVVGSLWNVFFTSSNSVGALWTPLVVMSLPWAWKGLKSRIGMHLSIFVLLFMGGWVLFCTSLRHAAGATLGLVLLASLAWEEAFKEKGPWPRLVFFTGCVLSFWLLVSAQLRTTAPYAAAAGGEDPLKRLKRHYSFSLDSYMAYRGIEEHSEPGDKVMAFAVFQTYPLERTAFVDFKWKMPIFLKWASSCGTAERLARELKRQGVVYFLYQRGEAEAMSKMEKDFRLDKMPLGEYIRFWRFFMEPVFAADNCRVYRCLEKPAAVPWDLTCLPGVQEKKAGS